MKLKGNEGLLLGGVETESLNFLTCVEIKLINHHLCTIKLET